MVIRNINDDIKERLRKRAMEHGTSMEAEVRLILANALKPEKSNTGSLGNTIAARFGTIGLDTPLPELHGETIIPVDFK
ncbi:MAG TPA: Arc family DNA-binding protein [Desulfocapsa sulfexigens]|nr:Arc family DNA-binding protein [Desulfocapsa sulfexigens]